LAIIHAKEGDSHTQKQARNRANIEAREGQGRAKATPPGIAQRGHAMNQIRQVRIYNYIDRMRKIVRQEGTPAIQEAWDKLEPHVSIFLQAAADDDKK